MFLKTLKYSVQHTILPSVHQYSRVTDRRTDTQHSGRRAEWSTKNATGIRNSASQIDGPSLQFAWFDVIIMAPVPIDVWKVVVIIIDVIIIVVFIRLCGVKNRNRRPAVVRLRAWRRRKWHDAVDMFDRGSTVTQHQCVKSCRRFPVLVISWRAKRRHPLPSPHDDEAVDGDTCPHPAWLSRWRDNRSIDCPIY